MGEPITGLWKKQRSIPYATAAKWGTGINPIHAYYDGYPLRTYGRNQNIPDIQPPANAPPGFVETNPPWGYNPNDIAGLDTFADDFEAIHGVSFVPDDRPYLGQPTTQTRATVPLDSARPWGSSGGFKNILRSVLTGPGNINYVHKESYQIPTETVSAGWVNKAASGMGEGTVANAVPSDPSQYEVQTSMRQRYEKQNNSRAVLRNTDDARTEIDSRVAPMKLKIYSGEVVDSPRYYDMTPRTADVMPRRFWYRTAGTGRPGEMIPNTQWTIRPIQRSVPPDPSLGPEEADLTGDYDGYTQEDLAVYY